VEVDVVVTPLVVLLLNQPVVVKELASFVVDFSIEPAMQGVQQSLQLQIAELTKLITVATVAIPAAVPNSSILT
jgi:hypothetical protein